MSDPNDLDSLRPWATPRQLEYIDGLARTGSHRRLARELGISRGTISSSLKLLRKRAAVQGWSPEHDFNRPVPDGFKLKRHSQYYDGDWYTLDTLTFMDFDWFNENSRVASATLKIVEGLTHDCEVVEVVYYATGDYEDRWVDVRGNPRDIIFWRPVT